MDKQMNYEALLKWIVSVGGKNRAMVLLMDKTGWGDSKASKVLRGKYEPNLDKLDRDALCELTNLCESVLFPSVGADGGDPDTAA